MLQQILKQNSKPILKMFIILLSLFIFLYLILGWISYRKIMKIYKFYNQTYPHLQNLPKEWKGFIRKDNHQWDKKEILLGCFIRFPIKFILFFQYILGCFFIILITIPLGSRTCNKLLKLYGRNYGTYLYKLIWTIKEPKGIHNKIINTPLVISNHVCWIDTMYLIVTFYPISFLSKAEISKIPIIGRITTNAQSIYIQRNDEAARGNIVKDIKERVELFLEKAQQKVYEQVYPLIIFPEGTTSNGESLLKFKMGAFNDLSPLTIVALKYTCENFDVGMVQITQLEHFLLSFCLKIRLDVDIKEMSPLLNQKPQQYCSRTQQELSATTGFKIYNSGFRERLEHKKLVDQILQKGKKQKTS